MADFWGHFPYLPPIYVVARANSGAELSPRRRVNFIQGSNVTLTLTDNPAANEISLTVAATVDDATISTSDITTNNASTAKHGWLRKLDNDPLHYLDGQGGWTTPPGSLNITTKGDIQAYAASAGRFPVGVVNGMMLLANSAQSFGMEWVSMSGDATMAVTGVVTLATVTVATGGSGRTSATAYAVLCGGTTSTAAHQSIAGVGTSGQVLKSNGAGALPTFQDATGGTEATQAEMESATGSTQMVTPRRVINHPGVAKGGVNFTGGGGGATVNASFGVTSVTRNNVGDYTVNWSTSFSSTHYYPVATWLYEGAYGIINILGTGYIATGSTRLQSLDQLVATLTDTVKVVLVALGDQ